MARRTSGSRDLEDGPLEITVVHLLIVSSQMGASI